MLDKIIHFSIHNKLVIGLFTLGLIAWGSYSATQLPIDAVPDITNNQVQVIAITPSLAAQEVERLITFPVEQSLATIPNQVEMRSFSRFGLSLVTVVFKEEVDIYWARQQVAERLKEAETQIPAGSGTPSLAPVTTGLGRFTNTLSGPKRLRREVFNHGIALHPRLDCPAAVAGYAGCGRCQQLWRLPETVRNRAGPGKAPGVEPDYQ